LYGLTNEEREFRSQSSTATPITVDKDNLFKKWSLTKKGRRPNESGERENLVGPLGTPTDVRDKGCYSRFRPRASCRRAAMFDDEMMRSGNGGALVRKEKRV
jgi:hypothetical protein